MAEVPQTASLSYRGELLRKALHLLALSIPIGMLHVTRPTALAVLWPLALAALGADVLRARWPTFHRFIREIFGGMMRPEELPPPGGPIAINGATWVLLSSALLATLFPLPLAATAFAVFMVGDAAAAVVGRRFGRHRWPGSRRTIEGSLAFFGAALLTALFFPVPPLHAVLAALLATVLEVLPLPLNDNLRVPLAVALLLWLVH
ncbi:diacylglycerol/polyprenol kinase family protein [Rhodothermus marinus]|uniref:diacylglycerol/polyprenol kinase family protein n=1 Tax=Rhodothermus marinus TaxID=29549 RepID=UPI0012BA4178|nr:phosphatidate cytidylyltransferase [Rhodothermus marinus]BBM69405.1 phosphatidate cytidylyltransferase [Rhodothermus marinus]BBM72387.1 phosphatidate cytidylyltransferase [Rhodothermus marinus]